MLIDFVIDKCVDTYEDLEDLYWLSFVAESPAAGSSRRGKAAVFCVLMTITASPAAAEQGTPAGGWYD
jgi:hypothetical protein